LSVDDIRAAVAVALAIFLVILRIDARRLGAAEYDEPDEWGRRPPFLPRLSWYLTGIALVVLIAFVHPDPTHGLLLGLGNDRVVVLVVGLLFGAVGLAQAAALAWFRYRRFRLPSPREYPGAILNSVGTAIVDEAAFRGVILGLLLAVGVPPTTAIIAQALVYVLATRVGAERLGYTLLFTLALGLAAGWVTVATGGIGAAVIGDAATRLAVFALTGHAAILAPRGQEVEEIERIRLPPPGWQVIGGDDEEGGAGGASDEGERRP
jgi:membrane protease YdiL (CAAX protease family)